MAMNDLLIYGANGYTGDLIARRAVALGKRPVLAGRSEHKVRPLADELGLDCRIFGLDDAADGLADMSCVLHCAGPFHRMSKPMVDACVATGTHYLDITGEIPVFEALAARSEEFAAANIMVMPGVGAGVSHGTATTTLESVNGGGAVRRDGKVCSVPAGHRSRPFDFGRGERPCIAIPWGDVSTAYYSTGIPNIITYFSLPAATRFGIKAGRMLGGLIASDFVQTRVQARIDALPAGPTQSQRDGSALIIVAEVSDADDTVVRARLNAPNGYTLTALAGVLIAEKVVAGDWKPGFQTPASGYGPDLVLEVDGVTRTDL
jgi:short subunit dehydrogenase-like uncharacterized protein